MSLSLYLFTKSDNSKKYKNDYETKDYNHIDFDDF